jgi:hypothetical protein
MNYEEFFAEAAHRDVRIVAETDNERSIPLLSNEALFQLPFLAMAVLMISKGRKKPRTSEIGQLIGECLERSITGFKGSSQGIGWSANLRIRTVKALTFLEATDLVSVEARTNTINTTEKGRRVLSSALSVEGKLANTLFDVERSAQNVAAESQIRLQLT